MTEDEAKQKWCPMARVSDLTTTYNRDASESSGHNKVGWKCIASDCMMWRWDVVAIGIMENPDGTLYQEFGDSPINGRCGLGGKV